MWAHGNPVTVPNSQLPKPIRFCCCNTLSIKRQIGLLQVRKWFDVYSISQEICTRFCFGVLCCGYTLADFPISTRLTSLALWQSNDCPSASKATLMNMDKYFMWIHYERLHNHNKAKHNKTVCIFLGIYCISIHFFLKKLLFCNKIWLHITKILNINYNQGICSYYLIHTNCWKSLRLLIR